MKKLLSTLCATTLAASFALTGTIPVTAAPVMPQIETAQSDVIKVQSRRQIERWQRQADRREFRRNRDGDRFFHNGYRGYREYRPGYRRHNGAWYPAAAFIAGALITGAIVGQAPRVRSGSRHVEWCYDRYRSYRASDNTFQPNYGSRRQCISPYS